MIKKNQKALYIFAGFLLLICAVILTIDYGSRFSMPAGLMGAYPGMMGTPTNSQPTTAPSSSPNIPFVPSGAQPSIPFTPPGSLPAGEKCTDDGEGNCENSRGSYSAGCAGNDKLVKYTCDPESGSCDDASVICGDHAKCGYSGSEYICICEPGFKTCPGDYKDDRMDCSTPETEECECEDDQKTQYCEDAYGLYNYRTEGKTCIAYECVADSNAISNPIGAVTCHTSTTICKENEKCQFSAYGEPECVLMECPEGYEKCYGPLGDVCFPQDYTHTCNPLYTELSAALKGEFGQRFCKENHGTNIINFTVTRWQAGSCCGKECCTQSGGCQKDSCVKPGGNAFACCLCEKSSPPSSFIPIMV